MSLGITMPKDTKSTSNEVLFYYSYKIDVNITHKENNEIIMAEIKI